MKLGLGTAQFGLDYGLSNREGKTPAPEVEKILDVAASHGIRVIDTAALYGESEAVLGKTLPRDHSFAIVTKTPRFAHNAITPGDARLLEEVFYQSLNNTRQDSLYGLLCHHAEDLLAAQGHLLVAKMLELKQQGLVKKIGVSVYTGSQLDRLMERYSMDIVQLPINVLDQRLLAGGYLTKLKRAGVEIHARSLFLQGLLLMEPQDLPAYFDPVKKHLENYHLYLRQRRLTPVQAALAFVAGREEIDAAICGVNNHQQLQEICLQLATRVDYQRFSRFAITDGAIVNPSRWQI